MRQAASELPPGARIECDVAIVGAGPAGLTVARALRGRGLEIVILDAGADVPEPDHDARPVPGITGWYDVRRSHFRAVGGSSKRWFETGWKARCLEPEDFEHRPWIPHSGWPLSFEDLRRHFETAQTICELGPFRYHAGQWPELASSKDLLDDPALAYPVFQIAPHDAFARLARAIATWRGFRIIDRAKVIAIRHDGGARATALDVRGPHGQPFSVEARIFVVAGGGFDVPRLLLASGLGNGSDLVGRFFQEHLHAESGFLYLADPSRVDRLCGEATTDDGTRLLLSMALAPEVRREHELLGCALWVSPVPRTHARASSTSLEAIQRRVRVDGVLPEHLLGHVANIVREPGPLLARVAARLRWPVDRVRVGKVSIEAECEPRWDSRVVLRDERDECGMPKADLEWRVSPRDTESVRRTQQHVGRVLEAHGYATFDRFLGDEVPPTFIGGGAHHMGTARMHPRPDRGVVDVDGRLHGCPNVVITGSALFPTSGFANPTLTLVALADRQAERLPRDLAPGETRAPS